MARQINFVRECRDIARACRSPEVASRMLSLADRLAEGVKELALCPSTENMQYVNSFWVQCCVARDACTSVGPFTPGAGRVPVPEAKAA